MHILVKSHVQELIKDFSYEGYKESKLFEFLCNYCIVSKHFFGRFQPEDVTTDEDDASIDGIAVIVDGDLIGTEEDAIKAFGTHKTNLSVDLVLVQAKSGEAFKKDDISNFKLGVEDFLSLAPNLPSGLFNQEAIKILKVVFANLRKVRNRLPSAHIYYCTSGTYKKEREIKACFDLVEKAVKSSELFHKVNVTPMGRKELSRLYAEITVKNEAKLNLIDYFGMPSMPGIPQSYVALVSAKHFVEQLLSDEDGNLRQAVFEENVRSFLGDDNDVNTAIQKTLEQVEKKKLFSVLNNGITIVAPELTLTPNTKQITITNYQIINGCQTSTTLHSNLRWLTPDVNVVIKFIESPENQSSEDIIAATNSQSDIAKEAFFGLRDKAKLVQKYFNAQNKNSADNLIYFERRQAEYRGQALQASRIFDVREVARCYVAMFLNQPHSSARYVSTIFTAHDEQLFKDDDHEAYYYASSLALYKYQTLINGRKNGAQNFIKLRWHVIQIFKWLVHQDMNVPAPNSNKADGYANQLIKILNDDKKPYIRIFEKCQQIISAVGIPSDDALKRAKFSSDLMKAVAANIQGTNTSGGKAAKSKSAVKRGNAISNAPRNTKK